LVIRISGLTSYLLFVYYAHKKIFSAEGYIHAEFGGAGLARIFKVGDISSSPSLQLN
jgi:hypothetical protein